jgi:hypothetical protein
VPHCFTYVWQYGVQCSEIDGHLGESCFWRGVMVCRVSVQDRLRGWRRRSFPFGRRLYADSRVQLTGGRKVYNSRRGDILSPRTPTASRMELHCPGWRRGGGDGRTGPTVMDEMRLTGPTSRRPSPFRGFRRPPSRVQHACRTRVGGTVSRS